MIPYAELLARKRVAFEARGLAHVPALHSAMFPHQQVATEFALRTGCAALFLGTGMGKTLCALEWGRVIVEHLNKPVLMLAPLAVGPQHQREAERFSIDARYVREPEQIAGPRIYITNYERLDKFDASMFGGVILDESSIIKSFTGATTRKLIETFAHTPFRLSCTATPAPNDYTEFGTQAEFLSVLRRDDMLPRWFIHDSADTGTWRIKGHAAKDFWRWVASWSRAMAKPSDLGFSDDGFNLPPLHLHQHIITADRSIHRGAEKDGQARLFRIPDTSATSIHKEKRLTAVARANEIANRVWAEPSERWLVWVDTDYEADAIMAILGERPAIEVRGSMPADKKEARLTAFVNGEVPVLVTKPSIAGHGLNLQHCARMAFAGLSFSFEQFYQAVRRCWRFGQTRDVEVHVAMADTERAIWDVVSRKQFDHEAMGAEMRQAMRQAANIAPRRAAYVPTRRVDVPHWMRGVA